MHTILPLFALYVLLALSLWGYLAWPHTLPNVGWVPVVRETMVIARRLEAVNWNGDDEEPDERGRPEPPPSGTQS